MSLYIDGTISLRHICRAEMSCCFFNSIAAANIYNGCIFLVFCQIRWFATQNFSPIDRFISSLGYIRKFTVGRIL